MGNYPGGNRCWAPFLFGDILHTSYGSLQTACKASINVLGCAVMFQKVINVIVDGSSVENLVTVFVLEANFLS